jgi:Leucine-rich repeat (LRR) protein
MIEGIQLEEGAYGRRAVVASAWSAGMVGYLLDNGIVELELNDGKGWRGNDLSFLAELPQLRSLKIIDLRISSVDPIHFLSELRSLQVMTYCQTEIRFSAFPHLMECALEWRPKATSLFGCTALRKLFVDRYGGKDVTQFATLVNLESLAILNAPVETLHGLSALKGLRSLRLANLKRLASLAGIGGLTNLEELEIHTCPAIGSIKEVSSLSRLKKLHLNNDGRIESLKPLANLNSLESVLFYESTNIIDGDLSPLLRQRNLSRVSFQNRRHYSHRREEFGDAYSG